MFIAILTIGLLGTTASAGLTQLAISMKGKKALVECIACATVLIPSMCMVFYAMNELFKNNIDFFFMTGLSLLPILLVTGIAKEKGLKLKNVKI